MNRLFAGIFLPQAVCESLQEICFGLEGARWQPADKLHITLEFLGKVEGQLQNDISDCLQNLSFKSFPVKIKGLGHFPLRKNPGVLWAGVDPSEELMRFRRIVHGSLKKLPGLKVEERKFHPHVTLARIKDVKHKDIARFYMEHPLYSLDEFTVHNFVLVKSTLHEEGSRYEIIESFNLEGDGGM